MQQTISICKSLSFGDELYKKRDIYIGPTR